MTNRDQSKLRLAFSIAGLLVVTAFIPVFQIAILMLNSVVLQVFGESITPEIWVNLALGLVMLCFFAASRKKYLRIAFASLVVIFMLPLFIYLAEGRVSDTPYFLQMLLAGGLTGVSLIFVVVLKNRFLN